VAASRVITRESHGPSTIAVLRALQLGDMLCAVPALRALRSFAPHTEIVLIGLPWAREFARRFRAYLDDFIELPGYPGLPERPVDLGAVPAFLATAQARRFELAIQMHGNGCITNPLIALLGARHQAGFYRPGQYCPDPARFLPYPEDQHEIRRHLLLMHFLGVSPAGDHLEFPIEDHDLDALAAIPEAAEVTRGEYACLHPGGRTADRRWPPRRFAAVADALAARGLGIVLTGSAEEETLVRDVEGAMRAPAVQLAGRTSLGVMAALLRGARLLICNDTGISHLAAAVSTPSVALFTASQRSRWAPLDRARHRAVVPPDDSELVERVTAAMVMSHADDLLQQGASCGLAS
jgi:ADP-heptose:LPS heptosyltransferase